MKKADILADLFRSEYSKIVSVLCKTFGLTNIQFAEDITSDTFLIATEIWKLKGIPESPKAWLYSVAKNKAKDSFKRDKIFADKIKPELQNSRSYHELEFSFSDTNITDSQLKMIFAICNPVLSSEAQITMALRILCGFGINEIAIAFLTSKSTINKRLARAKNTFRKNNIKLLPIQNKNIDERIDNVLRVIYLLFNEGYYSTTPSKSLKKELCLEAMRLNYMLLECSFTNRPKVNALMALLCFHSSRLDARTTNTGETILFANQDRSLWNYDLINKGNYYLIKSINNEEITKYHLEASIASLHSTKIDNADKWENILQLYNKLLQIEYSPVAALNRTYALSKARSKDQAISEALKIDLKNNHLYHSLLAELYNGISLKKELDHLRLAIKLVKTINERKVLEKKIEIASREQCI